MMDSTALVVFIVLIVLLAIGILVYATCLFIQFRKDMAERRYETDAASVESQWNHIRLLQMRRRQSPPAAQAAPEPVPDPGISVQNVAEYERQRRQTRQGQKVGSFEATTTAWIEKRNEPGYVPPRRGRSAPIARPPAVQPIPEEADDVSRGSSQSSQSSKSSGSSQKNSRL